MRGKLFYSYSHLDRQRITPAHAGKTSSSFDSCSLKTDHPRACGENVDSVFLLKQPLGSPPRMRGKPVSVRHLTKQSRITPAHAGKTVILCLNFSVNSDHPRACGENISASHPEPRADGSPPRMRGKPGQRNPRQDGGRITPAHAGKTREPRRTATSAADHPRACGENLDRTWCSFTEPGSPPRMRGKHPSSFLELPRSRITPAHAGKT